MKKELKCKRGADLMFKFIAQDMKNLPYRLIKDRYFQNRVNPRDRVKSLTSQLETRMYWEFVMLDFGIDFGFIDRIMDNHK